MAAVLACGPGAALSHRSAAALLDLLPYASATIHVVCDRTLRRRRGIHPHRTRSLDARDITTVQGIPTTTIPKTALDLAASWAHHRSRASFEADRMRDLELMADGHRIARVTSRGAREAMDLLAGLLR